MGIQIHPFAGTPVAFVRCQNVVTFEDMIAKTSAFVGRPETTGRRVLVVDLTPTIDIDLSFQDVRRFIPHLRQAMAESDISFRFELATPSPQTRAIASVFQLLTRGMDRIEVGVHRKLSDAMEASGLGPRDILEFTVFP